MEVELTDGHHAQGPRFHPQHRKKTKERRRREREVKGKGKSREKKKRGGGNEKAKPLNVVDMEMELGKSQREAAMREAGELALALPSVAPMTLQ